MDSRANSLRNAIIVLCAAALTAAAYVASSGLHRMWWPVWLAPLPVLWLSPRLRGWQAFAIALAARASAAAFSFWGYMHQTVQLPIWLTLVTILLPSAVFALGILFYRALVGKGNPALAMLAFPLTIVAGEYLFSLSQGTFFNTGYTQLANLPVLQLAAITGLWGISFSVNFFSAGLAAIFAAPITLRFRLAMALTGFYACVLGYGAARLSSSPGTQAANSVLVGLIETHAGQNMFPQDATSSIPLMHRYAAQIQPLAARGAQFVLMPEMTSLILDSGLAEVDAFWQKTALDAHVQILLDILRITDHGAYNEARLYSATGQIEAVYRKHHLVPTWENRTSPGTEISVLSQPAGKIGLEICRDMDYPELSRRYAGQQVGLMLVPAWDQGLDVDASFHGLLSVMRGVESGFTIVRDAKVGLLTVSDDRGRILAEAPTHSDGSMVSMIATVPVRHDATLYQLWGDWFAWIDLAGLTTLVGLLALKPTAAKVSRAQ